MAESTGRTVWILADTVGYGSCRGEHCGARLAWAETLKGKRMPFDGELVALRTNVTPDSRITWEVSLDQAHWSSCPDFKRFKRGGVQGDQR